MSISQKSGGDEKEDTQKLIALVERIEQTPSPRLSALRNLTPSLNVLFFLKDVDAAEVILTLMSMWWIVTSLRLLGFAADPTYYAVLVAGAPRGLWIVMWLLVALLQLIALITGNITLRRWMWTALMGLWFSTAGLLIVYDRYTAAGLPFILGVGALWSSLRLNIFTHHHE